MKIGGLESSPLFLFKKKKSAKRGGQRELYRHRDLEVKSLWFQQQGASADDDGPQRKRVHLPLSAYRIKV